MANGLSTIIYKNRIIYFIDYSIFQSNKKEKTLQLLKIAGDEWVTKPPNSVLSIINVTNFYFDLEVLNAFKVSIIRTVPNEKRMAIIGVNGLVKVAYNFVIGLTNDSKVKAFDSELEAKEWLISD